jgi:AraC-like DNA-binding protein
MSGRVRDGASREWARWRGDPDGIELLEAAFDRHVYERHMHETYALGVTDRGVQRFWCRGGTYDSTAGDVIVINPGETHDGRSGAAGGYAYRMLYVAPAIMRTTLHSESGSDCTEIGVARPIISDTVLAARLTRAWLALAKRPNTLVGDELLTRALTRLARHTSPGHSRRTTAVSTPAIHRVRDYLHAATEREVRLHELTALVGMSRFQLTRHFQRTFGLPLHAYHLHVRLLESRRRLQRGVAVAQVAADLAFADQSHFTRRFKGMFGISPGRWRAAVCTTIQDGSRLAR